ncbi:hypothetical protein B0H11DRAFT_1914958 [Mycena galericulata]|nr:hypothetical protein B0H11DRAFT_1914958 [Mycena galericulata]
MSATTHRELATQLAQSLHLTTEGFKPLRGKKYTIARNKVAIFVMKLEKNTHQEPAGIRPQCLDSFHSIPHLRRSPAGPSKYRSRRRLAAAIPRLARRVRLTASSLATACRRGRELRGHQLDARR